MSTTPSTPSTPSTLLSKPPAATLKPPAATPAGEAAKAGFVGKPKPVRAARQPKTLADTEVDYNKILLFGNTATGKSKALADLLEAGLTILALSTDIGGEGFSSVRQWLRKKGKADLLSNCYFFEIQNYDDMEDFCFNPTSFWPEIYQKDIDLLFLDGMSAFQICHVQDKILGMDALGDKNGEARGEGLQTTQTDWGSVRIATIKNLNKLLLMRNEVTGKTWHKVMTCLESDKAKSNDGDTKIGPMLQGASAKLLEPCFDLIIRTKKKRVTEGDKKVTQYLYELDGSSDRIITKSRGFEFNPVEPGDMGRLWAEICRQKGIPAGKR